MTVSTPTGVCVSAPPRQRRRRTIHPLFLDLGLTAITSGAVLITGLVVVSLMGKLMGAIALGEYLLLRRVYQWLQSLSLLGTNNALPRYVAMNDDNPPERDRYLLGSMLFAAVMTIVFCVPLYFGRESFGRWFFGKSDLGPLVTALAVFLAGGSAHAIVYGFYRGQLNMKRANMLQILNLVLVPLVAVTLFFHSRSSALIVDTMGIGMIVCSMLFAIPLIPQAVRAYSRGIREPIATLLRYGVPRVPAIFALGGLLAVGPIVASHLLPLQEVTALLLGMSIMGGISASAEPLGLILLSKVSMIVSQDRLDDFRVHLEYLQEAVITCYLFITLQVIIFADVLVRAWVGERLVGGIDVIRLTLVSVPFYLLFAALRSVIDAASVTPYNMYNIAISGALFFVFLAAAVFFSSRSVLLDGITASIVLGFIVLALLTLRTMRRLFSVKINWRHWGYSVLLGAAFAGVALLCRHAIGAHITLSEAAIVELPLAIAFLACLKVARLPWLPFFWNLALQRRNAHA